MSYLKALPLFTLAAAMLVPSHAAKSQISVNIGVAPSCPYGYFDYPPYECAPYGYYGRRAVVPWTAGLSWARGQPV
jgi:hypothetical protein